MFCFKQKTAYEMRISDWSSDVCSSDLGDAPGALPFIISFVERLGGFATLHLGGRDGGEPIACQLRDDGSLEEGDMVAASFDPGHLHLFGADGEALETMGK